MNRTFVLVALVGLVVGCKASSELKGRGYPCDAGFGPTTECPGNFVCGHEGFCVVPDAGELRACANDSECGDGWHCGPPLPGSPYGLCYDRDKAMTVSCRRELGVTGGDCQDGWRCGLGENPVCYNPADAGAVLCETDQDCAPDWRCAITSPRTCADVTNELLGGTSSPDVKSELVTPLASAAYQPYAYAEDSTFNEVTGLTKMFIFVGRDGGQWEPNPDDGGVQLDLPNADAVAFPLKGTFEPMVLGAGELLMPNGSLINVAGNHMTFKHRDYPESFYVATWSDSQVTVVSGSGRVPTQTISGPPKPIRKVVLVPDFTVNGSSSPNTVSYSLWALTDDGLFFNHHNGSTLSATWTPVSTPEAPNTQCPLADGGVAGPFPVLDVETAEGDVNSVYALITLTQEASGPVARWHQLFSYATPACDSSADLSIFYGKIDCPTGESPTRLVNLSEQWVGVDCRGSYPDGGSHSTLVIQDNYSRAPSVLTAKDFLPTSYVTTASGLTYSSVRRTDPPGPLIDAAGRLLPITNDETDVYSPPHFAIAPEFFSGRPTAAIEVDGGIQVIDGYVRPNGAPNGTRYSKQNALGLESRGIDEPRTCAPIDGLPDTALFMDPGSGRLAVESLAPGAEGSPTAVLEGSDVVVSYVCQGPVRRVHSIVSSGNRPGTTPWILTAAGDRIWAAHLDALDPTSPTPNVIPVVAVPAPSLVIDSFTVVDGDPSSSDLLTGYVLVHERLFRLRAETETRWVTEELPTPQGRPLAVMHEGPRARLGFDDGLVVSLPGLVPLSPALSSPVFAYGTLCGRIYAATGDTVYRLDPVPGATVGSWTQVPTDSTRNTSADPRFEGALFYTVANHMYVIDNQGTIDLLRDDTCGQ